MEIEEKLAGINGLVSDNEMENIKTAMQNPQKIICPFNKRFINLPISCIGYHYVCKYLNLAQITCNHPENLEWKEIYSSSTIKILVR